MKKFIPILILLTALACVSCGEKQQENSSPENAETVTEIISESSPQRTVNNYNDGILLGRWKNDEADIIFNENGYLDMIMDVSAFMHFTENRSLMLDVNEISSDFVNYNGSELEVSYTNDTGEKVLLMLLERTGEPDENSIDGRYNFTGGQLFDSLSANLGMDKDSSLDLIISGEECLICVNNSCSYAQDGDIIDFSGNNALFKTENHGDCYFTVEGDTLTIFNGGENDRDIFERVK